MTLFLLRRYLTMAIFFTMLSMLPLTRIRLSHHTHPGVALPPKVLLRPAVRPALKHPSSKSQQALNNFNGVRLRRDLKDYTYVFSGKVACGQNPCSQVEVRLALDTARNPDVEKMTLAQPDGSYAIKVSLKEFLHEQVDWKLTARSQTHVTEVHGRQILTDEPILQLERSLDLSRASAPAHSVTTDTRRSATLRESE